jgi:GDP-4-dehydro-6-deoxy-D-mannose reductase
MKRLTAFITGIAGFAGSFLAEELLAAGFTVSGSIYDDEPTRNIEAIKGQLRLYPLDILDSGRCRTLLARLKPDYIFHLAALASVGQSFEMERLTFRVNFDGTVNVLNAARSVKGLKNLLFIGSADVYGAFRPRNKTLNEEQPFDPVSPYGVSKAAGEQACRYYFHQHGVPITIARSFNHSGPRQVDSFVVPAFARQIAAIEAGLQKPVVRVGDLTARRDLSDVRDIVRGYHLAAVRGKPGEAYHFCSGKSVSMKRMLQLLLAQSHKEISLKVDPRRLRKSDIPVLRGSNRKATVQLGFKVRYSLKDMLTATLDYWRSELGTTKSQRRR